MSATMAPTTAIVSAIASGHSKLHSLDSAQTDQASAQHHHMGATSSACTTPPSCGMDMTTCSWICAGISTVALWAAPAQWVPSVVAHPSPVAQLLRKGITQQPHDRPPNTALL
ncbi:hypothetical protein E9531_00470 [Lampropedia puyangensis]|uniref:DUF2946 domain-containing protein n=2 Tax=Lampropedia puyangensis TaxID=1330072 RepID=A0A4V4GSB9_9BURK|nr:hypothetical protein E9531_00470 [Lampropedia puyangensis]